MLRQEYGFEIKRMQRGLPPCDSSYSPTIELRGLRNIPIWSGAVGQLPGGVQLRNFSLRPPAEYHFRKQAKLERLLVGVPHAYSSSFGKRPSLPDRGGSADEPAYGVV